jgi:hypothetical protein
MSSISFNSARNEKPNQNTPQIILIHHFILVLKLQFFCVILSRNVSSICIARNSFSHEDIFNYVLTKCWRKKVFRTVQMV